MLATSPPITKPTTRETALGRGAAGVARCAAGGVTDGWAGRFGAGAE
jgi:hypothetical protein